MYQTCSIGDKSGDQAGQSRWSTLFCCRNCCTILARWGLALSSCSTTWYHKTSSSIPVMFNSGAVRCEVDSARFEQTLLFQFLRDVRAVVWRLLEQECLFKPVRNRLHSAGLRARRPYVGMPLSQRHRQARLAWTRQNRRWTNQQWATVFFTDESRFLLDMLDRRRRVWRRRGERYANFTIVEHDRYGGGSLMVWGGISVRSRTELLVLNGTLTGQRYINEVLQPAVLPFFQQHHIVLQDDNARPHRARIVQQFLQQNNVDHLDWPARYPDVANRACLVHSRPACTTESSTTKNAPSFGRSLAWGVKEDTPATDCQTHQKYASSLCGLYRCNRWTYAILTDLCGFIGDPSDLPYKFSHSLLVLQTPTDGFLSVNEMM